MCRSRTEIRLHMSCLSTPRRLHAAALEGVGHEVAAAGMEPEVGCCAAALRPFAWKRRVCWWLLCGVT